ncbi:MAG: hypothetical protein RLZZ385_312 [Pseudomonadota bacterium]|jgi:LPS-assembly lipoprotein
MFTASLRTLLLTLILLVLAGCGFSLREADSVALGLPVVQLNLQQPNSDLSRQLRRELAVAGVSFSTADGIDTQADVPVLSVSDEQFSRRAVTVNPRARAAQYELLLTVSVTVHWQGRAVLGPETLATERLFYESIETITGNLEEMQTLQADMQHDLLSQLLHRLAALELGADPA